MEILVALPPHELEAVGAVAVSVGERGRLLRDLERLHHRGVAHVAEVDYDLQLVEPLHHGDSEVGEAGGVGPPGATAVPQEVRLLVGELHDPEAEPMEENKGGESHRPSSINV